MSEIVWGDPPGRLSGQRGTTIWTKRLAPFAARPGEWGRLPDQYAVGTGNDIRRLQRKGAVDTHYEVRESCQGCRAGRVWIYVRWSLT